jgi:uncharacterized OsmC-like protein
MSRNLFVSEDTQKEVMMSTITTRYLGDMLFESELGNHTLRIDVPAAMGGNDRGPLPPQIFIASLGSCIGAFVANYCQQSGLDARDMYVDVSFEKAESPGRLVNLKATVNLPHAECAGRERALRAVAEHCIIHETLAMFEGMEFTIVDNAAAEKELTPA